MTPQLERDPLLWKRKPIPELLHLAWPIAVTMLSYSVMTLVDTLFVGRLGASALAAVGLGGAASFTLLCFGFGLLRAVKVLVSQSCGGGYQQRIPAVLGSGLVLAVAIGAVCTLAGTFLADLLVESCAEPTTGRLAARYTEVRLLGAPLFLLCAALGEARQGLGDSRSPMRAQLAANAANIVLDAWFIFPLGLGVAGAAWATILAQLLGVALLLRTTLVRGPRPTFPTWTAIGSTVRIGLPLGLQFLLELGAFTALVVILARVGSVELAAHQIALQLCHFSFLPALAVGEAASVLVGRAVGAGQDHLVRRLSYRTLGVVSVYTGTCALLFACGAEPFARIFTADRDVQRVAVHLLYIAAAFQLVDGANIVARCVLRGTGDVRYPAVIAVVTAWIATPPLAWLLGLRLGLGAVGGWLALCVELVCGAALLWWRLGRGHWLEAARRSRQQLRGPSDRRTFVASRKRRGLASA